MDEFCGSVFWDPDVTWNTNNPDLTPCFEKTVLVWFPCGFLWFASVLDVYYTFTNRSRQIPRSPLNVSKIMVTLLLIVLELLMLKDAVFPSDDRYIYPVDLASPVIKIATYIFYITLLIYSLRKGVQSSGVQFMFWLLIVVCQGIRFRTVIENRFNEPIEVLPYVLEVTYFPLVLGMLLINCWADVRPKYSMDSHTSDKPCPEIYSSYLSRQLFSWFSTMTWQGYRKPLEYADLWDLNPDEKSRQVVPLFDKYWSKELNKSNLKRMKKAEGQAAYGKINGAVQITKKKEEQEYTSILPALFSAFGDSFIFGSLIKLIPDSLAFVSPQILDLLIAFSSSNQELWKGIAYALLLFLSAFISTMVTVQYSHRMYVTGMKVRTALISAIYRKALLLSNAAKRESSTGEIVNLMSVDVQKIMDLIPFVNMVWSAPFQIAVALYFLWGILGPSSLAGLGVMVLLLPANAFIAAKARKLQIMQMKKKDLRVKLMNEILSGIKVLKLYAWEPSFENQIMKIRKDEIEILKKAAYLNAATSFLWTCAPFLVALSTFGTYVLIDPENNKLDAGTAFVSLSLFNVMSMPLTFLPMIIVFIVQAGVSIKRLNKYMNNSEIDPDAVTHDEREPDPIVIEHGTFSWEPETVVLRDINLRIKPGSLVAIVGGVGSGKSSLLAAILGELDKISGRVNTKGSLAYVAQQAWIQNATLRNNILFGKPFDPTKYDKVVEACALKPDFEILPAGDKTEIGEKGINLSGGQKQRVATARAVYNNAEVYMFDDPLSAVDSHVGKHIFEKVLGPKGLLRKKTRVLVTHGIQYLPNVDNIIVLKDGQISEEGTYKELLARKGAFAEFLRQHIETAEDDISELEDESLLQDLKDVVGDIEKIKKKRRPSETAGSESEAGMSDANVARRRVLGRTLSEIDRRSSQASIRSRGSQVGENKLIEKEKSETESVKLAVYLDYFRSGGWLFAFATFFLYLMCQAFAVGANLWLSDWSSRPPGNGTESNTGLFLGVYGGLGVGQGFAILAGSFVMAIGTLKSASNLHWKMLQRVLKAPLSFFDVTPSGRVVNRFAKDVDICDSTLPFNFRLWLNSFFGVASTIFVISYSTPIFTAVFVPVAILYYFVQRFYVSTSRQLRRLESVTRSPIYSHFEETLTGSSTIRAYSEQDRFILDSENKTDYNQIAYYPSIIANRWLQVRLETVGNSIIFFAALFAVMARETLDPGVVGLSVSYALQITIALNMLVRWTSDVETNVVAVERVKEYSEIPQEADWEVAGRKPSKTWPERGEVKFDHYQTRYRPGLDLVLRNVTCTINPGEKVGIVGRTGAGKSSLTLALFRIVEAAGGSITIDGENISRLGLHDVRGRITIIPQDPVLFCGTLRINLDPFEQASDEVIWHALELAHLKTFVKTLPAGLEHEIAEGGENLSVGQRQLVCLARAVLRKTKILVLDEATAAVDLETDDLIQQTIRKEFKDSTVITIAHRLNTIMDSDKVMVLDKGEIREFDSPAKLLENKDSIFSSMARDAGLQ
ncbi:Multidrug resistance-associated protein 1 [Orchesella cincta]|uniref:ABC-type glutathione-S-conjugate transporter n=1 Tax=Orchesella cincta TaxID=48709 RepID=A0A1D2MQC8_ORCCI|nr:Multidrug resistance-associated protein 1 [Orchesella cincta]